MGEIEKRETAKVSKDDLRKFLCPTATDKELCLALNIVKSYGLDPFKREVYIIKYKDSPAHIVVGYEVYIKRAEATGDLDGWHVESTPTGARITIYRKSWDKPFEWEVSNEEFNKQQSLWKVLPDFMIKKVCIAQGFRLCFPGEIGGMPYTKEETELIDTEAKEVKEPVKKTLPKEEKPSKKKQEVEIKEKVTKLKEVNMIPPKAGTKNNPLYVIHDVEGYKYSTFSESFAKLGKSSIEKDLEVLLHYKADEYQTLVFIDVIEM